MIAIDFLSTKEVVDFIQENVNTDTNQLVLNPPKTFQENIRLIADQIIARRKAKGKLDEWADNYKLIFPPPLSVEQASSKITAEYKRNLIEGDKLIDLTGGIGIDCISLSENFNKTIYVEQSEALCRLFTHNQQVLKKSITVVNEEAKKFVGEFKGKATIFIDPARRDAAKSKVFKLEESSPNILELVPELRKKAIKVLIKLSPLIDIKGTLREIGNIKEVHVVSVKNDCKEVLLLIDFDFEGETEIHTMNLGSDQPSFSFSQAEEKASQLHFSNFSRFIYEPNTSILKAGAFKSIAVSYALAKIAPNTHLYTSDRVINEFPGKIFEILSTNGKKELEEYAIDNKINVITRNYTCNATELKKKYKLKDGGENFLIGFRDNHNKPLLIIAKKRF